VKKTIFILVLFYCSSLSAQQPSGTEILRRIDLNYVSKNRRVTSTMIVSGRRSTRTLTARSWIQGTRKAFTEYLSPPREKGTKMLKLENELWIYSPETDRTIKIAGHMLRRSLMGSDLSYEDYMEDPELRNFYDAAVTGEESLKGRPCYVVALTAKETGIAYHSRRMWVDKERYLPLKEERYAKSGRLLKRLTIEEVFMVGDRWYPKRVVFKDVLKKGDGTEFIIDSIEFDVTIPDHVFTKASLRK
jgi:outer membrane lipoprotein-sorting protein